MPIALKQHIEPYLERIENKLEELVPQMETVTKHLYEAARYSLLGGGKRLRPLLALTVCELMGGNKESVLQPACAIEMVHTYSMIHDDLPCMDDDAYRRGKPTVHCAFSESMAVLAGDFLLTYPFEVIATSEALSDREKVALVLSLSKYAGAEGMIGGQVLDIASEGKTVSSSFLDDVYLKKTAGLLCCAVDFGAIVAGVSPADRLLLQQFGQTVGLAYQIVDDILDVVAAEKKHGTTYSTDARKQKATYATLWGLEKAQQKVEELHTQANALLHKLSRDPSVLLELVHKLLDRKE